MHYNTTTRPKQRLWGELYMDAEGEPHFHCHTPGDTTFDEARTGLKKFIDLLQDKVDRQEECPFNEHEAEEEQEVQSDRPAHV